MPTHDFTVAVEIEWQWHNAYVLKRPGVEEFLRRMGEVYEVVVYTASVSKVRVSHFRWNGDPCLCTDKFRAVCGSCVGQGRCA